LIELNLEDDEELKKVCQDRLNIVLEEISKTKEEHTKVKEENKL
jgi:hypothetical protein